jgi:hypothetical protein
MSDTIPADSDEPTSPGRTHGVPNATVRADAVADAFSLVVARLESVRTEVGDLSGQLSDVLRKLADVAKAVETLASHTVELHEEVRRRPCIVHTEPRRCLHVVSGEP